MAVPPFLAIFLNVPSLVEVIEKVIVKVAPASTPPPDPFRVALERALSSGVGASATFQQGRRIVRRRCKR